MCCVLLLRVALRAAAAAPPMQKDAMMRAALLATATALSPGGLAVAECTITACCWKVELMYLRMHPEDVGMCWQLIC
jgi:hypothetical protein